MPPLTYQLEPLTWRDLRRVYRLEQIIFPKDAYPYVDLAFLLLTPGMVNLKAVSQQRDFLGFIAVADVWWRFNAAWVITLGVDPAYQNQGIGGYLLQAIEARLHTSSIRLTVRRSNYPALHLYLKMGYQVISQRPRYYADGEDGLIMEKELAP